MRRCDIVLRSIFGKSIVEWGADGICKNGSSCVAANPCHGLWLSNRGAGEIELLKIMMRNGQPVGQSERLKAQAAVRKGSNTTRLGVDEHCV